MEKPSKLQLCFHVTNVITWVPLKRGWNNTWQWSTRKLKVHLLSDRRKSLQGLWLAPLFPFIYNKEENCQNCDGTFSPGHQCDESEDDDGLSDSEVRKKKVMKPQNPLWSHCSGHCLQLNVQHLMCFRNWIPTISIKYELNAMWWPICQFGRRHIRLWKVYLSKTILYLPLSPE